MLSRILTDKLMTKKLNSLTKYPSIPTYHRLGNKGMLVDGERTVEIDDTCTFFVYEKIDGTNARIILCGTDYIIGSREELLYAKGDRIISPSDEISEVVIPAARVLSELVSKEYPNSMIVVYGEVYGGNIGKNARNYTKDKTNKYFRVFDVLEISNYRVSDAMNKMTIEEISLNRESGKQPFLKRRNYLDFCMKVNKMCGRINIESAPFLRSFLGYELPVSLEDMYGLMQPFKTSQAMLDDSGIGRSEGLILRSHDRNVILKARFDDYESTFRRSKLSQGK